MGMLTHIKYTVIIPGPAALLALTHLIITTASEVGSVCAVFHPHFTDE